jgi:WD40 repeat protein
VLAIARQNSSIEIWLTATWSQLLVIAGNKSSQIRRLHWLETKGEDRSEGDELNPLLHRGQPRRLLTTGLNGVVLEWDLASRAIKQVHTVHAPIWGSQLLGKFLYLACEDGSIKVLKVKKDKIELARTLTKAETKCLCLEVTADGKSVYAGYADSSVRRWEVETGNCTLHFQKATKASQKRQDCLIWTLKLFNNCVLTGDSAGDLSVWDATHGTLLK